jgi:two-component system, OmpR family, sensor histidine kinase KdpD
MSTRGVLAVMPDNPALIQLPEQNRLLQTCAAQIALALERIHYVDVAQGALVSIESERLRNSLLSAISHDIRTPLTAIVGLSSTLATARPLPEQTRQELAEAIQDNAVRMSNLVTNLLDMARLHAGAIRLNRQWQMLEEVVGSALAMLSETLSGLRIEVQLPATLPLLEFDAVLIERVLCNLLDNAAKYAAAGGMVRIAAEVIGHEVQVAVEDNGPGVPAGMESSIFTKFTRGELESSRAGVGLGLSICRSIIEAHGGRISAGNRVEGGARFLFTLPVGSPPAGEAVEADEFGGATGAP